MVIIDTAVRSLRCYNALEVSAFVVLFLSNFGCKLQLSLDPGSVSSSGFSQSSIDEGNVGKFVTEIIYLIKN